MKGVDRLTRSTAVCQFNGIVQTRKWLDEVARQMNDDRSKAEEAESCISNQIMFVELEGTCGAGKVGDNLERGATESGCRDRTVGVVRHPDPVLHGSGTPRAARPQERNPSNHCKAIH
jgi:hypothetical protein